jgi:hypothetical protein
MSHQLDPGLAGSCLDCRWLGTAAKRGAAALRSKDVEVNLRPMPFCHASRPCVGLSEWAPPEKEGGR